MVEVKASSASAITAEIADYSERAIDYWLSIGAEDKTFFDSPGEALWQVATITVMLTLHKGGLPLDGKFITDNFSIITCCRAICNLRDWSPDPRWPWTQAEMASHFQKTYGDLFLPMQLEVPEIAKLMRQVSSPNQILLKGPTK